MTVLPGTNTSAYVGKDPVRKDYVFKRDPSPQDFANYQIGDSWVNSATGAFFVLTSKTGGVGGWVIGGTPGAAGVLTVNTIAPDGLGDFTLVAGTNVSLTPGVNSLTIDAAGTSSFPVDNGAAGLPLAGAMSFYGASAVDFPNPSGIETHVGATTNEIYLEDRRWTSSLIVDADATVGLRGTFTTITAALAAAVPFQTIYVRPGTYTESFTLVDFVNIVGLTTPSGGIEGIASNTVLIDGTITAGVGSGSSSLQNLRINTAVGPAILVNDGGAIVNLFGCTILSTTFSIQMIEGNANIDSCYLSGGVNAIEYDTVSGPTVRAHNSRMDSGSSTIKIDTSSTFFARNCVFINGGGNCLEAAILGINVDLVNCLLISNGATAIDVSGGGSLNVDFCEVSAPGGSGIEFGAGGCAVRSYFNKYSVGTPNYITGTVGSYEYTHDSVLPVSSTGIDAGIVVTNLGSTPYQQDVIGLTTTVGAVSNTIITYTPPVPGAYTFKIQASAYDSVTPSGFSTVQVIGIRSDGVTATFVATAIVVTAGDGPLAAANISVSTAGNNVIIDADGVGGATANWKCVISEILFIG